MQMHFFLISDVEKRVSEMTDDSDSVEESRSSRVPEDGYVNQAFVADPLEPGPRINDNVRSGEHFGLQGMPNSPENAKKSDDNGGVAADDDSNFVAIHLAVCTEEFALYINLTGAF